MRDEDFREQASGIWRWRSDRLRRSEGRPYVNFSIDVLARRIDGRPLMTIVLRSQPLMTPQTAPQTQLLPNFAAARPPR